MQPFLLLRPDLNRTSHIMNPTIERSARLADYVWSFLGAHKVVVGLCLAAYFIFKSRDHVKITKPRKPLELHLKNGKTESLDALIQQVPGLKNGDTLWYNPLKILNHVQTIMASQNDLHGTDLVYYARRMVDFDDGVQIAADYVVPAPKTPEEKAAWKKGLEYKPEENTPKFPVRTRYKQPQEMELDHSDDSKPMLILLHGLTGGSYESYVRAVVAKITSQYNASADGTLVDFECVVMNTRGCARTTIKTPELFNGCWTEDVRRFVKDMRKRYPNRRFYMVGFSLGASILANYLGQEAEDIDIEAACVVANPWDLCASYYALRSSWSGRHLYNPQMAKNLLRMLRNHREVMKRNPIYDESLTKHVKSIVDFDNLFTAPMFGFDTATDYYRHGSSCNRIMNIRVPTLILHALDDPVAPGFQLPYHEIKRNPYTVMAATNHGGHIGWFHWGKDKRWFPSKIAGFFSQFEKEVDHTKDNNTKVERLERRWENDRLRAVRYD